MHAFGWTATPSDRKAELRRGRERGRKGGRDGGSRRAGTDGQSGRHDERDSVYRELVSVNNTAHNAVHYRRHAAGCDCGDASASGFFSGRRKKASLKKGRFIKAETLGFDGLLFSVVFFLVFAKTFIRNVGQRNAPT